MEAARFPRERKLYESLMAKSELVHNTDIKDLRGQCGQKSSTYSQFPISSLARTSMAQLEKYVCLEFTMIMESSDGARKREKDIPCFIGRE